jgi:hypothetical protein
MARTSKLGPAARPVALPDDVDDPRVEKATGTVELPLHVRWSDQAIAYDLSDQHDRARVYEQVLREGDEDDIRHFIVVDHLIDLWDELVLPPYVRSAWAEWLGRRRRVDLWC